MEGCLGECQDSVWRDVCGGEVSEGCLEVFWGVSGGVRWSGMGLGGLEGELGVSGGALESSELGLEGFGLFGRSLGSVWVVWEESLVPP